LQSRPNPGRISSGESRAKVFSAVNAATPDSYIEVNIPVTGCVPCYPAAHEASRVISCPSLDRSQVRTAVLALSGHSLDRLGAERAIYLVGLYNDRRPDSLQNFVRHE